MSDDLATQLVAYGASPEQLVDLGDDADPRTLRYTDLVRAPTPGARPAVVYETNGRPCAYVFDAREPSTQEHLSAWIRRVTFRGDAEWVGVLRPGRLDVYRAALTERQEAPQPIADEGSPRLLFPSLVQRVPERVANVRTQLLKLLRTSIEDAKALGVGPNDALSLVGRAVFWRFLIDRGLLEGTAIADVCPGAPSWPDCIASKTHAAQTFVWLDTTFNGGLLPLEADVQTLPDVVFSRVLGNLAHLATEGQLPLRMPTSWGEVDFAHVPVGLLSEVYEAFAHAEEPENARDHSIFYTPRHIAELMVGDALAACRDVVAPRVLDPAAGAGVFLVAAFRALVAREWARTGCRPPRSVVRRILDTQLTGFDINDAALRLAELALYLTAIELDPDVRPRPLTLLRFDALRRHTLHQVGGGAGEGSLAPVREELAGAFDLVVGNPPWTARSSKTSPNAKASWTAATRPLVERRLGAERAAAFDFPDNNPDLPFVYRAMEWARPGGIIALVTAARWLFLQTPRFLRARRDIFECVRVTGILNGAALRDTSVWPNVRSPFCLLMAINELPPPRSSFLFVSPELDHIPDGDQQRMRIDWQDGTEIEAETVLRVPWTLKMRFRGTPFDEALVAEAARKGQPLGDYLAALGASLKNGYKVGGNPAERKSAEHLAGLLDLGGKELALLVDGSQLDVISHRALVRPRKREMYRAPLLILDETRRVDARSARAGMSFSDVAFDERFNGASFADVPEGKAIAEYVQLVVQSSYFEHALLMLDGQDGVEREVAHLETMKRVPVLPWDRLSADARADSKALSTRLHTGLTAEVQADIDAYVNRTLGLSRVLAESMRDTLDTALPTASVKKNAVRRTTDPERARFVSVCEEELTAVLNASGQRASVRELPRHDIGMWRLLLACRGKSGQVPVSVDMDADVGRFVVAADDAAASLVTVRLDENALIIGLLDRYRYWTPTRARMLAGALLDGAFGDV